VERVFDDDVAVAVAHESARPGDAFALKLVIARELGVLFVLDDLEREGRDDDDSNRRRP
jgi:hypothetical protein